MVKLFGIYVDIREVACIWGVGLNMFWFLLTLFSNILRFCLPLIVSGMNDCFGCFIHHFLSRLNFMCEVNK